MSEKQKITPFAQNGNVLPAGFDIPPLPFQTDGVVLAGVAKELANKGEPINQFLFNQLDDERFISGLKDYCEKSGESFEEYLKHSNRFASLDRFEGMFNRNQRITIPEGPENPLWDGRARREETGSLMDLEYIRSQGVNPDYVLYFRATQPISGEAKPEYYWTSDLKEVKLGLSRELGRQASTAIILVSTLGEIYQPSGLIDDINDDSGIAVRQIGLEPFDQQRALFSFPRE